MLYKQNEFLDNYETKGQKLNINCILFELSVI